MKFSIEVKDDQKTTVYSVDTTQFERKAEDLYLKTERFLKDTFKKETINKKES